MKIRIERKPGERPRVYDLETGREIRNVRRAVIYLEPPAYVPSATLEFLDVELDLVVEPDLEVPLEASSPAPEVRGNGA